MQIKFTNNLVQSLLKNDYDYLNHVGFISVSAEGLDKEQWAKQCHEAAVQRLIDHSFADLSALYIDGFLHLKADNLRSITSFRSRNLLGGDKENGYIVFSNTGKIIFKHDEEYLLDWDLNEGSILLNFCDRAIADDFFFANCESLTAQDFMQCSRLLKKTDYPCTNDYLRAKVDIASEHRTSIWGFMEYGNFDHFLSSSIESSYLIIEKNNFEILVIENSGIVGIVDIEEDYINYFNEGEAFGWRGIEGIAEAGVLEVINMQVYETGVKTHLFTATPHQEETIKNKRKPKPWRAFFI